MKADIYSRQANVLGEAPLWSTSEQALYWLDIGNKALFRRAPADDLARSWALSHYPGCLAELASRTIAIALGGAVQRMNVDSGEIRSLFIAPPGRPGTRFNDGKVDPRGRLWVGTMQNNFGSNGEPSPVERADGALYRFERDGCARTIEENVGIANTLAWSVDSRRFYFADSLRGEIYAYDFDAESGVVRNKRVFFDAAGRGIPDGSAMDVDGCLWNARWDGGAILRITPAGKVDRLVELPVPRPTSCAFGGARLDTLYVTSARLGLTAQQLATFPLSGSVFALRHAGQGVAVAPLLSPRN
jgi:sugar lactone lactonase YvrE